MQELTEYRDRIRFSGFFTKIIFLLYAIGNIINAGYYTFFLDSFVPSDIEGQNEILEALSPFLTANLAISLVISAVMAYLAFRIKFFELKGDKLQVSDYFNDDWIDPRDITEVRLLFYHLYLVRLSKPCRYGTKIIFARSIRDTLLSLLTKATTENQKIHWLREFAAANTEVPQIDEKRTIGFNALFFRIVYAFFGFFSALVVVGFTIFFFVSLFGIFEREGSEVETGSFIVLLTMYMEYAANALGLGTCILLGYIAFKCTKVSALPHYVGIKKPNGNILLLDYSDVIDVRYYYDWVYAVIYVEPVTGQINRAYFARSLFKTIGSLFTAGTIEYQNLRDFRQRVLERRYFNGQLASNPMMEFLPQPRVLELAEIETN